MSKYVGESQDFIAWLDQAPTGLAGTIEVEIKDIDENTVYGPSTANVAEVETGVYRVELTAPGTFGEYAIIWGENLLPDGPVSEPLTVVRIDVPERPEVDTTVVLEFFPPNIADLIKLRVFEAVQSQGPWTQIDETEEIGSYPQWITQFITHNATSLDNWFSVAWEDSDNDLGPLSYPIIGRASTVVYQLIQRCQLRDPSIDENVALQEAEAVVEFMGIGTATPTAIQMSGMTSLTMARIYTQQLVRAASSSEYVAGLISQKNDIKEMQNAIKMLQDEAARDLHLSASVVAQMTDIPLAGGLSIVRTDITRLLIEVE